MNPFIAVPATILLVARAYRRQSLTTFGIVVAILTAIVHALYPSPVPFTLLIVFFLLGTSATKVKHDIKATLTVSSSGAAAGEGTRTSVQVLANSGMASVLILIHLYLYGIDDGHYETVPQPCFGTICSIPEILLVGIIANYAAVTADTLSSELGILSRSHPRLITTLREVPPGTNGGVTPAGLLAGFGGSLVIGTVSAALLPVRAEKFLMAHNSLRGLVLPVDYEGGSAVLLSQVALVLTVGFWGALGSLLDSFLGAILQASVVDRRTGKIVEATGGVRVKTSDKHGTSTKAKQVTNQEKVKDKLPSRFIGSGRDILDNNQINFLMASLMSLGGMATLHLLKRETNV